MTSIFETYAARVCQHAELPPKVYTTLHLNSLIMGLPLAESHAALMGVELAELPRLGDQVSLNSHVQSYFFDVVADTSRKLLDLTKPVLIKREYLERLEGWRDWRTLSVYLSQEGLEPSAVFRNRPIPIKTGPFETVDYYVADIRMVLARDTEFTWKG